MSAESIRLDSNITMLVKYLLQSLKRAKQYLK